MYLIVEFVIMKIAPIVSLLRVMTLDYNVVTVETISTETYISEQKI